MNGYTSAQSGTHVDEVLRHSRALKEEAGAVMTELKEVANDVSRALDLRGRMDRTPYATMAVAVGVGYVLGGGLFSRFTGQALRVGTKVVLVPFLKNQLLALGQAAAESAMGVPGDGARPAGMRSEDGEGGF